MMTTATQSNPRVKQPFSPKPTPNGIQSPGNGLPASVLKYQCPLVPIPANWVPGAKQGEWTYDAYAKIPEDGQRYEVIEGVLYLMSAPRKKHQYALLEIATYLRSLVQLSERGEVLVAPFDVQIDPQNVFQPDVTVVLNEHLERSTEDGVVGAPDLVVEILSPSTKSQDRGRKQAIYARAGVSEYWIVDPSPETVEVLVLADEKYRCLGLFSGPALVKSLVVPDFSVKAEQIFPRKKASLLTDSPPASDAQTENSIDPSPSQEKP